MLKLPNRGASSSLVANKHLIEIMAHESSISIKKELNCRFEPLDGATSACHPKAEGTYSTDPKELNGLLYVLHKLLDVFLMQFSKYSMLPNVPNIRFCGQSRHFK